MRRHGDFELTQRPGGSIERWVVAEHEHRTPNYELGTTNPHHPPPTIYLYGSMRLSFGASCSATSRVPRILRFDFVVLLVRI